MKIYLKAINARSIEPMPSYYDIVLLAGQSNMSGRGVIDPAIDTTDPNVYQCGCYDGAGTYRIIFAGSAPMTMPDYLQVGL